MAAAYSDARNIAVRAEDGFTGILEQYQSDPQTRTPSANLPFMTRPGGAAGASESDNLELIADRFQQQSTSRQFAPSAVYPGQMRPGELRREVVPKNNAQFKLEGRNIGPHATADAVGGYAGRDMVKSDLNELGTRTERTVDDFREYMNPSGPRKDRGNASVYSLFAQNRIESREISFKNTPGRFTGAYRHDIRRPGHAMDNLAYHDGFAAKPTMKNDKAMVFRQRADEGPNREGLRMQYADIYSGEWNGWERLETPRKKEHARIQSIDQTLVRAYDTNPYTVPRGYISELARNPVQQPQQVQVVRQ